MNSSFSGLIRTSASPSPGARRGRPSSPESLTRRAELRTASEGADRVQGREEEHLLFSYLSGQDLWGRRRRSSGISHSSDSHLPAAARAVDENLTRTELEKI